MSYLDQIENKKKKTPSNQQALLSPALKSANTSIEGGLTKFQAQLRQLSNMKEAIGTESDNYDARQSMLLKIDEISKLASAITTQIDEYSDISVAFKDQSVQAEKQGAFRTRHMELVNRFQQDTEEI